MKINKENLKVDGKSLGGEIIVFTIGEKETYIKYDLNGHTRQITVETEAVSFD